MPQADSPTPTNYSFISINDFYPRYPKDKAFGMVNALTAYIAADFSWLAAEKAGLANRRTVYDYMKCPIFRQKIDELGPLRIQIAESVLHDALTQAPWPDRIRAAQTVLSTYHPEKWDVGVRREVAKAKGNVIARLLSEQNTKPNAQVPVITEETPQVEVVNASPSSEIDR